jgi:SAM-dependent methyltransferase
MTDAYRENLAFIHDAGFSKHAHEAGQVLLRALAASGLKRGLVIDLGCGSGVLADELSSAGYDVLGIDISPAMIELARQRVPRAQFRVASLLEAELPPCVAVTAIGECLNYLFDRSHSIAKLRRLCRRIYKALAPRGLFLFDIAEPGRVPRGGPRQAYFEGDGWTVLVTSQEDRGRRLLTRRITSFRRVGTLYRRDEEVHQQRLLTRSELATQLRGTGFRVRVLRRYGAQPFAPARVGIMARKPPR